MSEKYRDSDGNACTLDALCRREPAWAANRIRANRKERDELRAKLDDAIDALYVAQKVTRTPYPSEAPAAIIVRENVELRVKLAAAEGTTDATERYSASLVAARDAVHAQLEAAKEERDEALARLRAVGEVLGANGCDCDCDHDSESHEDDCERCLACRISAVLDGIA